VTGKLVPNANHNLLILESCKGTFFIFYV